MRQSDVRRLAEKHDLDLTIELEGRTWHVDCYAPDGKVWRGTSTHVVTLYGDGFHNRPEWRLTVFDLKREIAAGFDDCEDADCDVCAPETEERP